MKALLALAALALPAVAQGQAISCAIPTGVQSVRPDLPDAGQPRRLLPIGGYTLAITWAPEYCRSHADAPSARFQCGGGNRFGFTLHGLWPDGVGRDWPQYCRNTGLVSPSVIRGAMCTTPSAQLIQHEWAKHGTCMAGETPQSYLRRSGRMYANLRYPDMDALSRRTLTTGGLAAAMAAANPGLRADMMRITTTRQGWLDEIWICLDRRFAYARCPAHQGGTTPATAVRIWRGRR